MIPANGEINLLGSKVAGKDQCGREVMTSCLFRKQSWKGTLNWNAGRSTSYRIHQESERRSTKNSR